MLLQPHMPAAALAASVASGEVVGPTALGSRAAAWPRQWWQHLRAEAGRQAGQGQGMEK